MSKLILIQLPIFLIFKFWNFRVPRDLLYILKSQKMLSKHEILSLMCSVDKFIHEICLDDYLYHLKLQHG